MKRDMRLDMQRSLPPLPRSFYLRQTIVVAQDLLGGILVRRIGNHLLAGKIVEVEAYREASTRPPTPIEAGQPETM